MNSEDKRHMRLFLEQSLNFRKRSSALPNWPSIKEEALRRLRKKRFELEQKKQEVIWKEKELGGFLKKHGCTFGHPPEFDVFKSELAATKEHTVGWYDELIWTIDRAEEILCEQ